MAIDGSAESRVKTSGLSANRPEARMTCAPHVEPLVSKDRMRITLSHKAVDTMTDRSTKTSDATAADPQASTNRIEGAPEMYSEAERSEVYSVFVVEAIVTRAFQVAGGGTTYAL